MTNPMVSIIMGIYNCALPAAYMKKMILDGNLP